MTVPTAAVILAAINFYHNNNKKGKFNAAQQ